LRRGAEVREVRVEMRAVVLDPGMAYQLVAGGMGVAMLAESVIQPDLESGAAGAAAAGVGAGPGAAVCGVFGAGGLVAEGAGVSRVPACAAGDGASAAYPAEGVGG